MSFFLFSPIADSVDSICLILCSSQLIDILKGIRNVTEKKVLQFYNIEDLAWVSHDDVTTAGPN